MTAPNRPAFVVQPGRTADTVAFTRDATLPVLPRVVIAAGPAAGVARAASKSRRAG